MRLNVVAVQLFLSSAMPVVVQRMHRPSVSLLTSLSGVHVPTTTGRSEIAGIARPSVRPQSQQVRRTREEVEDVDTPQLITNDQNRAPMQIRRNGHQIDRWATNVINEPIWSVCIVRNAAFAVVGNFYFVGKFIAKRSMCHWQTFLLSIM